MFASTVDIEGELPYHVYESVMLYCYYTITYKHTRGVFLMTEMENSRPFEPDLVSARVGKWKFKVIYYTYNKNHSQRQGWFF